MEIKEIFKGVYKVEGRLATINLTPGSKVYGERVVEFEGKEYRSWDPYRSKLSAAILNGLGNMPITPGMNVLYLGAASGTTASHVSDIVGSKGKVFCVEFAPRSMRDLINVCEKRKNMLPILGDARKSEDYENDVGKVDCIYQDVAQPDQGKILLRNAKMLKLEGWALFAIKSQSIDVTAKPKDTYRAILSSLEPEFLVLDRLDLNPFDKDHLFVSLKKKHQ
ncbi:MAG: fibrillarin-like rRNA/tRNA 2'-O-methyltransferase [Candidatus Micrarchaeota archaeon]